MPRKSKPKFDKDSFRRHGKRNAWYASLWSKDHGRVRLNRLSGRFRQMRPASTMLRRTKGFLSSTRLARFRKRR